MQQLNEQEIAMVAGGLTTISQIAALAFSQKFIASMQKDPAAARSTAADGMARANP